MNGFTLVDNGMDGGSFSLLRSVCARKLRERGCSEEGIPVCVVPDPAMDEDEYRVSGESGGAVIRAGGTAGFFSAVGGYMRGCRFDGAGGFLPFVGEASLKPTDQIHGIYFATHFRNYYEAAPADDVMRLIEDLALQGCNALMVWYDMHQYADVDTPQSKEMIARLKSFCRRASLCGMKTVFLTLANESFCTSDPAIRAEWKAQNGYFVQPAGHYHVEICPNKPGGLDEILRQRRRMMEAFGDIRIDLISVWPYDQGGCTCEKCAPWGSNGFLKTLDALRGLYAEILPGAELLVSTWFFDHFTREWDGFNEAFNTGRYDYVRYLFGYFANGEAVPDFIRDGKMPGGKPMIAFPEISMFGCMPWGGFGANPMPARMEENFRQNGSMYFGALPYSEGIYEDINKSLMLAFYSGRCASSEEVLREYARFEFCLDGGYVDDFVRMIYCMERTLNRRSADPGGEYIEWEKTDISYDDLRFEISNPSQVAEAERLAAKIDAALPENIRNGWRWKILRLRAAIDAELASHDMRLTGKAEGYMERLTAIYSAQNALYAVTPLTRASLRRSREEIDR